MGPNIAIEETWTPEPELIDRPPRRVIPSDYPDLNGVNLPMFLGGSAIIGLIGLGLFIGGMAGRSGGMIGGGIVLTLLGVAAFAVLPMRQKQHLERAERLVEQGMPVAARLLSADPLNGSPTARVLRYQVANKEGELIHQQVNADDAVLPKRIPTNVTALIDLNTGDVELYLALPFRAEVRSTSAAGTQVEIPVTTRPADASLGTITTPIPTPTPRVEKPKEEDPKPKRETYE